jgi:hypothetical protein
MPSHRGTNTFPVPALAGTKGHGYATPVKLLVARAGADEVWLVANDEAGRPVLQLTLERLNATALGALLQDKALR